MRSLGSAERWAWALWGALRKVRTGEDGPPGAALAERRERELATVLAALREHVRPADRLTLRRTKDVAPTLSTCFGGLPYMERDETWPVSSGTGEPLQFFGQLQPSDLPHHPAPELGLITLFLDFEDPWSETLHPAEDEGLLVLRSHPRASLARAARRLPDDAPPAAPRRSVKVETCPTLPSDASELWPKEHPVRALLDDFAAWHGSQALWEKARATLGIVPHDDLEAQVGGWSPQAEAAQEEARLLLHVNGGIDVHPEWEWYPFNLWLYRGGRGGDRPSFLGVFET